MFPIGILIEASHRKVDQVYFIPILLKSENDIGGFYISVDVASIVEFLDSVYQLYGYFRYNWKGPIELTLLTHIMKILSQKISHNDTLLCLYKIALYLGNALHVCNFFKHLKFVWNCWVIIFLLNLNAGKIIGQTINCSEDSAEITFSHWSIK